VLSIGLAIVAAPVAAHPEDEIGGAAQRGLSAADHAQQAISKLVAQKKLPPSWANATLVNFDFRNKSGTDQYVLTYENSAIKQPAKRKLFVLMTASGQFISAGYKLS